MNNKYFLLSLLLVFQLFPSLNYAQQVEPQSLNFIAADSSKERPVQYRRGIELQQGYQGYEEKYSGKNLNDEKRRLFPLESTGVWTELNPKVPRVDYLGIQFVNKDTGWAVGDLGTLIKSIDGGTSWTVSETNSTSLILKVRSYNGQVVIASGFGGKILRSTDGGETFTQVTSNVAGDLWGLQMINDTLGWACGNANSLTKTTDGGQTWQRIFTPGYTSDYWWIDFLTEDYGFMAANGKVLRTIDGGQNWEIIQAGDSYPLFTIDVIDSLHIAAAGYGGTGYTAKNIYSSDGGNTWINGGMLTTSEINCIKYISLDTGYVVMSNIGIWKTTNRGQNWTITGGIGEYELQYLEQWRTAYNAGTELKLWKAEGNYDVWHRMIINDNFADVFFVSEEKGFAISGIFSQIKALYMTTNGGIYWTIVPGAPNGNDGYDLLFLDSLTGFIGMDLIYKTTDGGVTWYVPIGGQGGAGKIFFVNETIGWAVRSNVIYKTTDRGENWFIQFTAPASVHFTSINFADALYGWVSGGRPYKTTDGGQNWIQQTNTIIWNSDDVYFTNMDTGWFAKYSSINNSLFKTTDAGLIWLAIPEVIGARKFYFFADPIHWLIIGFSRYYITNDYGNNWLEFTNDVPTGINSFHAPTNTLGNAVGSLGLILRYEDTSYVPIELISFEGKFEMNKIILSWKTASEINNAGFYIEKSFNNEIWFEIGFVEGRGTTTEPKSYSFTDKNVSTGTYKYRLKQIDFDDSFEYSHIIEVYVNSPSRFSLEQNYPNPFNSTTNITFQIPSDEFVSLKIYGVLGNEVESLVGENKKAGYYSVSLNANNLSSGIYFYKLTAGENSSTKKFLLLK
jgi:photosystem II stability/assembly factor-like uncharacterized protein